AGLSPNAPLRKKRSWRVHSSLVPARFRTDAPRIAPKAARGRGRAAGPQSGSTLRLRGRRPLRETAP
ncbi:MAG: hypothetical protein AB7H81_25165, partial [Vicinamibacterales bacterium]